MAQHNGARVAELLDAAAWYRAGVAVPVSAAHRVACLSSARAALARVSNEPSPLSALVRAERRAAA